MARVRLEEVTADNWEEVVELELEEGQEAFWQAMPTPWLSPSSTPMQSPAPFTRGTPWLGF